MTMRILFNAGMTIAKDDKREADSDNPHGYFEIDGIIDKIKDNPEIALKYKDQVLKVTHYGIKFLPKISGEGDDRYKIVYVDRDIEEVLDSMEKMIGKPDPNRDETRQVFIKLNEKIKSDMDARDDMDHIIVSHRDLVNSESAAFDAVIDFLDIDPQKKDIMMSAVDRSLYRNKN